MTKRARTGERRGAPRQIGRVRWHLAILCAALLAAGWLQVRGRPQHMMDLPGVGVADSVLAVRDGRVYYAPANHAYGSDTLVVRVADVDGSGDHELLRDAADGMRVGSVVIGHTALAYSVASPWPSPPHGPRTGAAVAEGVPGQPAYTVRDGKLYADGKLVPDTPAAATPTRVRIVRLDGGRAAGPAREIRADSSSQSPDVSLCAADDEVWWIDYRPGRIVYHPGGPTARPYTREYVAAGELRAVSMAGGEPRTVAAGAPEGRLERCGDRVVWNGASPREDDARYICFARPGSSDVGVLRGYSGVSEWPVHLAGRWYWLESADGGPRPGLISSAPVRPQVVMGGTSGARGGVGIVARGPAMTADDLRLRLISVADDGSDRRTVVELGALSGMGSRAATLWAQNGRLYVVSRVRDDATAVYALRPGTSARLEKAAELPAAVEQMFADGPWLYFVAREQRENWFDWSQAGLTPTIHHALYRVRLPD